MVKSENMWSSYRNFELGHVGSSDILSLLKRNNSNICSPPEIMFLAVDLSISDKTRVVTIQCSHTRGTPYTRHMERLFAHV